MANVQKQFGEFHDAIKHGRFDESKILREKRDIIRDRVNSRLPDIFEAHGEECPTWSWRDQGSYEMDTGVKPLSGDYDIDQGLYFDVSTEEFDPVTLKKRVKESLVGLTKRDPEIRRPCVTVWYQREDEAIYHVDIAVYSAGTMNDDGKDRLAVGRENSGDDFCSWDISAPKELSDKIFDRFEGDDRKQFRRVTRYFKRWRAENFSGGGHAAPTGIALMVAAYHWLANTYFDPAFSGTSKPDDHGAMLDLVRSMLDRFEVVDHDEEQARRLIVKLPVDPGSDLLERMTNKQMERFEEKLTTLRDALSDARDDADPVEACERLERVFGDDFPVPERKETAQKQAPAIISSSNSA